LRYGLLGGVILCLGACSGWRPIQPVVPTVSDVPSSDREIHLVGTVRNASGHAHGHADLRMWRFSSPDTLIHVVRQFADSNGGFVFKNLDRAESSLLEVRFVGSRTWWSKIEFPFISRYPEPQYTDTIDVVMQAEKVILSH